MSFMTTDGIHNNWLRSLTVLNEQHIHFEWDSSSSEMISA